MKKIIELIKNNSFRSMTAFTVIIAVILVAASSCQEQTRTANEEVLNDAAGSSQSSAESEDEGAGNAGETKASPYGQEALSILSSSLWADDQGSYLIIGIDSYSISRAGVLVEHGNLEVVDASYEVDDGVEGRVERYEVRARTAEGVMTIELVRRSGTNEPWVAYFPGHGSYVQITDEV